jgi:hypothetical protein
VNLSKKEGWMSFSIGKSLLAAALSLLAALLLVLATNCTSCEKEEQEKGVVDAKVLASLAPDKGIQISLRLDEGRREDAARLVSKLRGGRFPSQYVDREKNAELFLYIAAKSDQPKVIIAALRAMRQAYVSSGGRKSRGRHVAGNDYGVVVAAHLKSKDPSIVAAAMSAAQRVLEGTSPHAATVAELARIAESHPVVGARIDAVSALTRMRGFRRNPVVAGAMLKVLEHPSAALLSHTLYQLYRGRAAGLPRREEFLARAQALLSHQDPGVRGRAARLVAVLAPPTPELAKQLRAMLSDPHPYTRSVVAHALADMNDVASVHLLVTKVDDLTRNSHHLTYRRLVGREGSVPHGARDETVHGPVVRAIERLTAKLKHPFKRASKAAKGSDRKKEAAAVKAWYAKHRDELPKLETMPEPPASSPAASEADGGAATHKAGVAQPPQPPGRKPAQKARVKAAAPAGSARSP